MNRHFYLQIGDWEWLNTNNGVIMQKPDFCHDARTHFIDLDTLHLHSSDYLTNFANNHICQFELDPTQHRPACLKNMVETVLDQKRYDDTWPNHCKRCDGYGFLFNEDSIDDGERVYHYDHQDPCPVCAETLFCCPRCGHTIGEDSAFWDKRPCPHCGFDWGRNPNDFRRPSFECYCFEYPASEKFESKDAYVDWAKNIGLWHFFPEIERRHNDRETD